MTDASDLLSSAPLAVRCVAACEDYLAACRSLFEGLSNPAVAAAKAPSAMSFLEPWKAFAERLGMRSGEMGTAQFRPETLFGGSVPALGYLREHQEIGQRMLELAAKFNNCYTELLQQGSNVAQQALQAIHADAIGATGDASILSSPRRAYDAWVDGAEQAYSQLAHSEEFARALAELCNILSAFKIERGKMIEYFSRQFDLPTRAEVDSLHREVRALREQARRTAAKPEPVRPKKAPAPKSKSAKSRKREARKREARKREAR